MSISDIIVVMKLGVLQQVGKPQDIYDDPKNLFVAKFLGTPPINVFRGYIKGGKLYIGGNETPITETREVSETVETENGPVTETKTVEEIVGYSYDGGVAVLDADKSIEERGVYIGIRPEGFEVKKKGTLECVLSNVEVMGRDCSVVCTHAAAEVAAIRAIIDSDTEIDRDADTVKFALKPNKVFAFDKWTEERIYF